MKHYFRNFLLIVYFLVSFFYPFLAYTQSIGIASGLTITQINRFDFNKEANITAYQLGEFKTKVNLAVNFEYPLNNKFRLRSEISYYSYGYELKQDFGYNYYWANNMNFSNLQIACLADVTLFKIGEMSYFSIYGGLGGNYVMPALIRFGTFTSRRPLGSINVTPPSSTSIAIIREPYDRNHAINMTLISGIRLNFALEKGKFYLGCNYNRGLQASPQLDMKFSLIYNGETTTYNDILKPKIHFINFYCGYAWFLKTASLSVKH